MKVEGKKCFPFTSVRRSGRNGSRGLGSLTVEVGTTHESNSAFSTFCSTLSLILLALENGARDSFSVLRCRRTGTRSRVHRKRVHGESRSRVYASIVRDVLDLTNFQRRQSTTGDR